MFNRNTIAVIAIVAIVSFGSGLAIGRSSTGARAMVSVGSSPLYAAIPASDKYHYPSCPLLEKIDQKKEIWFDTVKQARDQGYLPCEVCGVPETDSAD